MSIALADALEDVELEEGWTYRCEVHGRLVEVRVLARPSILCSGRTKTVVKSSDLLSRLEELRNLKEGWLDGAGRAPSIVGLDWFEKAFEANYPDDLPQPFVYPTAEGGLQLEWSLGGQEVSLEVDLELRTGSWHSLHLQTHEDEMKDFALDDDRDWIQLAAEIRRLAGVQG